MEYSRIDSSTSQGFSPRKLRAMLLGVEKMQLQQEDPGGSSGEVFKDVSMVSSVEAHNVATLTRVRSLEEGSEGFEFHKARSAFLSGFAKAAPSKWDDAQKWISSPGSNRGGRGRRSGRGGVSKVVVEVEEEEEDLEGTRVDVSEIKREIVGGEEKLEKESNWELDSCGKSMVIAESAESK